MFAKSMSIAGPKTLTRVREAIRACTDRSPATFPRQLLFALALLIAPAAQAQVVAAVAANLQNAFEDIRTEFTRRTAIEVRPVYGASGKLQSQIRAGAPFDVFISADVDWPDSLVRGRHAVGGPRIYAYGKLVLWITADVPLARGLQSLADPAISKVAIGDLRLTVYGPAAWRALEKAGLLGAARPKLVYGANIAQVAQYVATGAAQAGFIGKGQIMAGPLAGKGRWIEIDEKTAGKLPQAMVLTRHGAGHNPRSAQALLDFLAGEAARRILERHGYGLP